MIASRTQHKSFRCMGTQIELWVSGVSEPRATRALNSGEVFLKGFDKTLSRFAEDSELTALNNDPRETVPVSRLMSQFIAAALWAADASGGLVDPTLNDAMVRVGYAESREGKDGDSLTEALAAAPPFRSAQPDPAEAWRRVKLDKLERTVTRPPGLMLDSGGSGKGLAADMLSSIWQVTLGKDADYVIDLGGDIRIGGSGDAVDVKVEDPFDRSTPLTLPIRNAAIATSGIGNRIWRQSDGSFAHHLIDPRSSEPAWTGLIAVTAIAPTTLIAETIAKTALLSGPETARTILRDGGGVLVHADGTMEQLAP